MFDEFSRVTVIGGGLAGVEAAWQIAQREIKVCLYEMRPARMTPVHTTDRLAELVCSNSLGADQPDKAPGLLKQEMRLLGSLVLACAEQAAVPAGSALAVDRERFAQRVTEQITAHPLITVIRQEVTRIPDGVTVIASGPLTSDALAAEIARLAGTDHLYFWDAIAPIVTVDSIDFNIAFRASRYGGKADGDYINCPMTRAEYEAFVEALLTAETATLRDFELRDERFFEGCLPSRCWPAAARTRWPSARCGRSACATRAPASGPTLWSNCARTTSPARSITWSASRPTSSSPNRIASSA
jgi:methylenetetrahydrofolate--tRNA-(uracil-5-)-methyltransferase